MSWHAHCVAQRCFSISIARPVRVATLRVHSSNSGLRNANDCKCADAHGASDEILTAIHHTSTAVAIDVPPAKIRSRDEPLFMTQVTSAPEVKPKAVAADANNIDAAAVVDDDKLQLAWQKVREALPESPLQRLGRLAFIDVPKTHTQVWLYWRRSENEDGDEKPVRQVRWRRCASWISLGVVAAHARLFMRAVTLASRPRLSAVACFRAQA